MLSVFWSRCSQIGKPDLDMLQWPPQDQEIYVPIRENNVVNAVRRRVRLG